MSASPREQGSAGDQRYNLLLVEDDAPLAQGLKETLATAPRSQFKVTHVSRLADAVTAVHRTHYDVVLLDLNLPDARGTVAPRTLQKASDVPIVILTGVEDEQLAEENARAGVQD